MTTLTLVRTQSNGSHLGVWHFALANLKGSLKNKIMMAVALFTPLMLLLMFWLTSGAAGTGRNLMAFLFPGIVAFVVIQAGGMHAATIVTWREQGIFQRLACTPTPLWQLVLGRSMAQGALSLLQVGVVLLAGVALVGLPLSPGGLVLSLAVLGLGSACFIALGTVIAGLSPNATIANSLYIFLVIPLLFLGDALMPSSVLPEALQHIGRILPTAMLTTLVRSLLVDQAFPASNAAPLLGLIVYSLIFVLLSVRLFRWQ